jgi:transposase-like protein
MEGKRQPRPRISEEIRQAILAADPAVKHAELARIHGISDVSVYTIRKQAGIARVKGGGGGKVRKKKPAKKRAAPQVNPKEGLEEAGDEGDVEAALLSCELAVEALDQWWEHLSGKCKADIFAANFAFSLAT